MAKKIKREEVKRILQEYGVDLDLDDNDWRAFALGVVDSLYAEGKIPQDEYRALLEGALLNIAAFFRTKIWELHEKVQTKGRYREVWSIRDLWYWIKPYLMRYERITEETPKWDRKRSQTLSSVLSKMVLAGELTYRSLLVTDEDRKMLIRSDPPDYKDIIVYIEKNGVYNKLHCVSEIFDVSIISGKGFIPTSSIEKILDRLYKERHYKVIFMVDYDPYGSFIAQDFERRATILGLDVEFISAGLHIDHVPPEHLETVKYLVSKGTLKQEFYDDWVAKNPMGNFGLELQCFAAFVDNDAEALRKVLVNTLIKHCPEKIKYDRLLQEAKDLVPEGVVDELIDENAKVVELEEEIADLVKDLEAKLYRFKEALRNILTPVAEEKLEDCDDEREIPKDTLKDQAIKGNTNMFVAKYTDTDEIASELKEIIEDLIEEEEIELPSIDDVEESDNDEDD